MHNVYTDGTAVATSIIIHIFLFIISFCFCQEQTPWQRITLRLLPAFLFALVSAMFFSKIEPQVWIYTGRQLCFFSLLNIHNMIMSIYKSMIKHSFHCKLMEYSALKMQCMKMLELCLFGNMFMFILAITLRTELRLPGKTVFTYFNPKCLHGR